MKDLNDHLPDFQKETEEDEGLEVAVLGSDTMLEVVEVSFKTRDELQNEGIKDMDMTVAGQVPSQIDSDILLETLKVLLAGRRSQRQPTSRKKKFLVKPG